MLISAISKVAQLRIYIHSFLYSFPHGLPQDVEYSSLCCTVGLGCLSIPSIIVCICQLQTLSSSLPLGHHKSRQYF